MATKVFILIDFFEEFLNRAKLGSFQDVLLKSDLSFRDVCKKVHVHMTNISPGHKPTDLWPVELKTLNIPEHMVVTREIHVESRFY